MPFLIPRYVRLTSAELLSGQMTNPAGQQKKVDKDRKKQEDKERNKGGTTRHNNRMRRNH
jgi:hypothetical protein